MTCITIVDLHAPKHVSDHTLDLILSLEMLNDLAMKKMSLPFVVDISHPDSN